MVILLSVLKTAITLKLKEIAKIEAGARSDNVAGYLNGGSSVVFPVYLTSDANALETVNNIKAVLADAETRFPEGMELTIVQDNTQFVREALEKVAHTFFEAFGAGYSCCIYFPGQLACNAYPAAGDSCFFGWYLRCVRADGIFDQYFNNVCYDSCYRPRC